MLAMNPPPKDLYHAALLIAEDAKRLTQDVGPRMAEILVKWVQGLKERVQAMAVSGGIPTDIPLSPVTEALKGSSGYGYDPGSGGRPSKLWAQWEFSAVYGDDWARAWGIPEGISAHTARAAYPNWLLFARLSHVAAGGIYLTPEQRQKAAAYVGAKLGEREVPRDRARAARVYYVPARALIPAGVWDEEIGRLRAELTKAVTGEA